MVLPSGKCSYERPTRGTVCGTMRSMCGADAGCLAINYQSPPLVLPSLFVAGRGVCLKGKHRGHGCVSQLLTRSGGGQVWTTKLHDGRRGCICTTTEEERGWFQDCPVISCGYVWCIAFSPDGDRVVSGAQHGAVHIWSAATGAQVRTPGRVFRVFRLFGQEFHGR